MWLRLSVRAKETTEAIGNTAPNLPPPRKKGSLFGKLLMAIVAIVVTIYTAGALSGVTGSLSQVLSAGLGVISLSVDTRNQGAYDAGGSSLALPAAVLMTGAPGLRFNLKGDFATGAYAPKTAYSVAYEMELSPASYGKSPHFHKKEAAASYRDTVEKYPDYGEMMEPLGIPRNIGAQGVKSTPSTWIWEHASTSTADGRTGVMRLVPREQHTPGSQWWRIIHPDPGAAGGYAEWARPAGAPRR